jgi:LysM repeat protein
MSAMRSTGNKSGNNTLIFIAGGLTLLLIALIFWGTSQKSTIDQLLMSAAPDSSGYVADSNSLQVPGEKVEETAPVVPDVKPVAVDSTPVAATQASANDSSAKTPDPVPVPVVSDNGSDVVVVYKIRSGDTMYKIAAKFGNKPADIMSLNGLTDMSVQADKDIKVKIKGIHTVGGGEGLLSVAEKYAVPAKSIKVANGLTSDVIPAGSKLIIPLK